MFGVMLPWIVLARRLVLPWILLAAAVLPWIVARMLPWTVLVRRLTLALP